MGSTTSATQGKNHKLDGRKRALDGQHTLLPTMPISRKLIRLRHVGRDEEKGSFGAFFTSAVFALTSALDATSLSVALPVCSLFEANGIRRIS